MARNERNELCMVKTYLREYGEKYYHEDIFKHYPEARIIPAYIKRHFAQAKVVLDLGFGSGLWFWASFLPALERIDGIDLYREALEEASRVFEVDRVPAGYRVAHEKIGQNFTLSDLKQFKHKRGYFAFQDYREPWPEILARTRYDLVTEHGGGLGQMSSDAEVVAVIKRISQVLKPSGYLLFVNFVMKSSALEQKLGRTPSPAWRLRKELFEEGVTRAGMKLMDCQVLDHPPEMENVEEFFYGYAQKQ
jgi:SAM-dependent methyltransferase